MPWRVCGLVVFEPHHPPDPIDHELAEAEMSRPSATEAARQMIDAHPCASVMDPLQRR